MRHIAGVHDLVFAVVLFAVWFYFVMPLVVIRKTGGVVSRRRFWIDLLCTIVASALAWWIFYGRSGA